MHLANTFPRLSVDNLPYGHLRDPKRIRKSLIGNPKSLPLCKNGPDLANSKLAPRAPSACQRTPLLQSVLRVLGLGSQPKMTWPHTCRVVATGTVVTNLQTFWNFTDIEEPACPACWHRSSMPRATTQHPVPVAIGRRSPQPASVSLFGLFHLRPKSFWERLRKSFGLEKLCGNFFSHIKLWLMCHAPCSGNCDGAFPL